MDGIPQKLLNSVNAIQEHEYSCCSVNGIFDAALNGLGLSPSSWSNKSFRINWKYNILPIDTVGAYGLWSYTMYQMERNDYVPWCLKRLNQVLSG